MYQLNEFEETVKALINHELGMKMHKDTKESLLYRFFVSYHSDHDQYLTYQIYIETLTNNILPFSSENYDWYLKFCESPGHYVNSILLKKNYVSDTIQESLLSHLIMGESNEFSKIVLPWLLAFTFKVTIVVHKFTENNTENKINYEMVEFYPSRNPEKFNNNTLKVHMAQLISDKAETCWYILSKNYSATKNDQYEISELLADFQRLNADKLIQPFKIQSVDELKKKIASQNFVKLNNPLKDENDWLSYSASVKKSIDEHIKNLRKQTIDSYAEKNFKNAKLINFEPHDLLRFFFMYHNLTDDREAKMSFDEMVLYLIANVKAAIAPHDLFALEKLKLDCENLKELSTNSDKFHEHNCLVIKYYIIDYLLNYKCHEFLVNFMPHIISAIFLQPIAIHEIGDLKSITKINYGSSSEKESDLNILIHRNRKHSDKVTYLIVLEKEIDAIPKIPDFNADILNGIGKDIDFLVEIARKKALESEPRICEVNLKEQKCKLAGKTNEFFENLNEKLQKHMKVANTTSEFYECAIRKMNFDELPIENDRNSNVVTEYIRSLLHKSVQTGSVDDKLAKYFKTSKSFMSFKRNFKDCINGAYSADEWSAMIEVHIAALTKIYANTNLNLILHTQNSEQAVYIHLPALVYQYKGSKSEIRNLFMVNAIGVDGYVSPCFFIDKESFEEMKEIFDKLYTEKDKKMIEIHDFPKKNTEILTATEFCKLLSNSQDNFQYNIEPLKLDKNTKQSLKKIVNLVNESNRLLVPKIVHEAADNSRNLCEQLIELFTCCGLGDMSAFNMLGVLYALIREFVKPDIKFRSFIATIANNFTEFFEENMQELPEVAAPKPNRPSIDLFKSDDKFSYYTFRLIQYLLGKNVCEFFDAVLPWLITSIFNCEFELYKIAFVDGKFQLKLYKYAKETKESLNTIRAICIDVNGEKSWFTSHTKEQIDNYEQELNCYDRQCLLFAEADLQEPKIKNCFKNFYTDACLSMSGINNKTQKFINEFLSERDKFDIKTPIDICGFEREEIVKLYAEASRNSDKNIMSSNSIDWIEMIFSKESQEKVSLLFGELNEFISTRQKLEQMGFKQKLGEKFKEFEAFLRNLLISCDALHRNSVLHLLYSFEIDSISYLMLLRIPPSVILKNVELNNHCLWVYTDQKDNKQYFVVFKHFNQLFNCFESAAIEERKNEEERNVELMKLAARLYTKTSHSVLSVLESQRREIDALIDFDKAFRVARASMLKKSFECFNGYEDFVFVEKKNALLILIAYLMSKEGNENAFIEVALAIDACIEAIIADGKQKINKNFDFNDNICEKIVNGLKKVYKAFTENDLKNTCAKFAFAIDNLLLNNFDFQVGRYILLYLLHKIAKINLNIYYNNHNGDRLNYGIIANEQQNYDLVNFYIHFDELTQDNYYFFLNDNHLKDFNMYSEALSEIWSRDTWAKMMQVREKGLQSFLKSNIVFGVPIIENTSIDGKFISNEDIEINSLAVHPLRLEFLFLIMQAHVESKVKINTIEKLKADDDPLVRDYINKALPDSSRDLKTFAEQFGDDTKSYNIIKLVVKYLISYFSRSQLSTYINILVIHKNQKHATFFYIPPAVIDISLKKQLPNFNMVIYWKAEKLAYHMACKSKSAMEKYMSMLFRDKFSLDICYKHEDESCFTNDNFLIPRMMSLVRQIDVNNFIDLSSQMNAFKASAKLPEFEEIRKIISVAISNAKFAKKDLKNFDLQKESKLKSPGDAQRAFKALVTPSRKKTNIIFSKFKSLSLPALKSAQSFPQGFSKDHSPSSNFVSANIDALNEVLEDLLETFKNTDKELKEAVSKSTPFISFISKSQNTSALPPCDNSETQRVVNNTLEHLKLVKRKLGFFNDSVFDLSSIEAEDATEIPEEVHEVVEQLLSMVDNNEITIDEAIEEFTEEIENDPHDELRRNFNIVIGSLKKKFEMRKERSIDIEEAYKHSLLDNYLNFGNFAGENTDENASDERINAEVEAIENELRDKLYHGQKSEIISEENCCKELTNLEKHASSLPLSSKLRTGLLKSYKNTLTDVPEEDSASSSSIQQESKSNSPKSFSELDKRSDFLSTLEEFAKISKEIVKEQESIVSSTEKLSSSRHLSSSSSSGSSSDESKNNGQLNPSFNYRNISKPFDSNIKSNKVNSKDSSFDGDESERSEGFAKMSKEIEKEKESTLSNTEKLSSSRHLSSSSSSGSSSDESKNNGQLNLSFNNEKTEKSIGFDFKSDKGSSRDSSFESDESKISEFRDLPSNLLRFIKESSPLTPMLEQVSQNIKNSPPKSSNVIEENEREQSDLELLNENEVDSNNNEVPKEKNKVNKLKETRRKDDHEEILFAVNINFDIGIPDKTN